MAPPIIIEIKMKDKLSGKTENINKKIETLRGGMIKTTETTKRWDKGLRVAGKTVTNVTTGLQKFKMHQLGVMFAGMAIQRAFQGLARGAVQSFTKIMESNQMLGTALQQVAVGFEYIRFIIGSAISSALEPLLPKIFDIINAVGNWIQKNDKLTAKIIFFGIALGLSLFIIGQVGLALNSFAMALGVTGSALWGALGVVILYGIAIWGVVKGIKAFIDAGKDADKETKISFGGILKTIINVVKFLLESFGYGMVVIGTLLKIFFIALGGFIRTASDIIASGVEALFKSIINTYNNILKMINRIRKRLGQDPIEPVIVDFEIGRFDTHSKDVAKINKIWGDLISIKSPIEKLIKGDGNGTEPYSNQAYEDWVATQPSYNSGAKTVNIVNNNHIEGIDYAKGEEYARSLQEMGNDLGLEIKTYI